MPPSEKSLGNKLPIIRIPGDGRCLFRSVAYGACLRTGESSPSLSRQKELADELRAKVVDEFIKRRADTEWFLEGDFDTYTVQMRKPHIWGGEPELLMSSHVLELSPFSLVKLPFTCDLDIVKESLKYCKWKRGVLMDDSNLMVQVLVLQNYSCFEFLISMNYFFYPR